MSEYRFSVVIEVNSDTSPTDATIGLASGIFTWFIGELPDSPFFNNGKDILARDGITPISKSVNIRRTGDTATSSGFSLKIKNTEKFWIQFITAFGDNVSLHGSKVSILELNASGTPTGNIFQGVCDLPNFDKSVYNIPIRAMNDARDSKMGLQITEDLKVNSNPDLDEPKYTDTEAIGDIVPMTFGENDKTYFLQTGSKNKAVELVNSHGAQVVFPVLEAFVGDDRLKLVIQVISTTFAVDFDNLYALLDEGYLQLKVVSGTGQGQIVAIDNLLYPSIDLEVYMAHPLNITLDTTSRISFIDRRDEYNSDYWQCEGFIDESGQEISADADIFVYNETFERLPQFAIDVDASETNENQLVTKDIEAGDSAGEIVGFNLLQDNSFTSARNTDFFAVPSEWQYNLTWNCFLKFADSHPQLIYSNETLGDTTTENGSDPFALDFQTIKYGGNVNRYSKVYQYKIPNNIDFEFDSCYLVFDGLAFANPVGNSDLDVKVKTIKWFGDLTEVYSADSSYHSPTQTETISVDNFPHDYTSVGLEEGNFWNEFAPTTKGGYNIVDLGVSSLDELNALDRVAIMFGFNGIDEVGSIPQETNFYVTLKSASLCFKGKKDTKKGVYTNFKGRLYDKDINNSIGWSTNSLINDPIGALAHTKWLQNYNSSGQAPPTLGWGKEYPSMSSPLFEVQDADGSYYHTDFFNYGYLGANLKKQIVKQSESTSKFISKDLCNKFFLMAWVNGLGQECVTQLPFKSSQPITIQVDQSDMISWGKRVEQDTRDIFCEPVVNYDYNVGSKRFNRTIAITRVSNNLTTISDKASAVLGLDSESENTRADLWDRARALYDYYGVVNTAPKVISDQNWIGDEQTAFWFMRLWLSYQGAGIVGGSAKVIPKNYFDFSVPYEVGRLWDVGTRLEVKIPNITDDVYYQAVIYSTTKDITKELPEIKVKVVLYDLETAESQDIDDSFDDTLETWQDTIDTNADNIRDEV